MSLETGILLWLHIFGAVAWLGAALVFGMLIGPTLPKLSPSTRGEVTINLFPKLVRYVEGSGVFTVILGFLLLYAYTGGNFSVMAPTNQFGLFMSIGALLALITVGISFGLVGPNFLKVARIYEEMRKGAPTLGAGGAPPPEFQKALNRGKVGAMVGLILLIIVLICMVAAVS